MTDILARPATPTLDAFLAQHDRGARFQVMPGGSVRDFALELYDRAVETGKDVLGDPVAPAELAAIAPQELKAAQSWRTTVNDSAAMGGGTVNAHPEIVVPLKVDAPTPTPTPVKAPAIVTPAAAPVVPPIPATPLVPGTVVTEEHHNAVVALLGKLGHGIAGVATPENLTTLAQILAMFSHKK